MSTRFDPDYGGIGEACLRSGEVRAMIAAKTSAVFNAAKGEDKRVTMEVAGKSRARGYVKTLADREARTAVLERSLGSAR